MIRLIRLTLTLFAVEDSYLRDRNQLAVGTLVEATAYLKDFHGTTVEEVCAALAVMQQTDGNTAEFGVINGGFMYPTRNDITDLMQKVDVHMKARVAS